MRREGEQQVIEHPGIGEIGEAHADPRQDRDDAEDLHGDEDFAKIGGIARPGERLTDLITRRQIHGRRSEIEQA